MTHEELLAKINKRIAHYIPAGIDDQIAIALRAVVELHKPEWWKALTGEFAGTEYAICAECSQQRKAYKFYMEVAYPCPTIQAIQEQLK